MAVDDGGQRGAQIGQRLDGIELAGFDERGDGCPVLCSRIVASEERVLAVQRYRPNGSLNAVIVDLDATVGQEDTQAIPEFGDIGDCFSERRLSSDAGTMKREPCLHIGDQRR